MHIEPWADSQLSADLPRLARAGENETVEFKREMPKQVRDLAKEIAAFASSRGGKILVGVDDNGDITGVADGHVGSTRDELCRRIVGICEVIDPPVRPALAWANCDGAAVLVVTVEKGTEPLYYVDHRGYIRHDSVSRPATSAEIKAAMAGASAPAPAPVAETPEELAVLAVSLAEILRWSDTDPDMRSLTPWVEEWASAAGGYAATLHDLAASDWAIGIGSADRISALAEAAEEVAEFTHFLGGGDDFDETCAHAGRLAADLMRDLVDPAGINLDTQHEVMAQIRTHARKLDRMWARAAEELFDGQVEKAVEASYDIGKQMAAWTYLPLTLLDADAIGALRRVGLGLLQLSSERIYFDGGASQQRMVDAATVLTAVLNTTVSRLPGGAG